MPELPGWNSLGAVTRYHSWAEIIGIVVLALLVISEVVAYRYGQRKDQLTAEQQNTTQSRHDEEMTRVHQETAALTADAERSRAAIAMADAEAATANERAAELKLALEKEIVATQPRKITPEQHAQLVDELSKIEPKGAISVTWKMFDEEASAFGKQLLGCFQEAGFDARAVDGPLGFGLSGQWIMLRDLTKFQTAPSWVGGVQTDLKNSLGLLFDGQQMNSTFKPELGDVLIAIGAKP